MFTKSFAALVVLAQSSLALAATPLLTVRQTPGLSPRPVEHTIVIDSEGVATSSSHDLQSDIVTSQVTFTLSAPVLQSLKKMVLSLEERPLVDSDPSSGMCTDVPAVFYTARQAQKNIEIRREASCKEYYHQQPAAFELVEILKAAQTLSQFGWSGN